MAIQNDVLQQQRMKNLAAITRGGCVGTGSLAVHGVRPANIAMGAAPVAFLADGSYDATLAQTAEIDLSDVAVCAEGGDVIPSGNDVAIFIIHNGTAALARVGRHTRTMERSGVTGALTTVDSWLTFPEDVDMDTYICIGFAKFTTAADFTVGTTSLTDQTATYTNIRNLMPGTKIAAV